MSMAPMICAIVGPIVAAAVALAGLWRSIYNRGYNAGEEQVRRDADRAADLAKFDALQQQLADTRAELSDTRRELAALQSKSRLPARARSSANCWRRSWPACSTGIASATRPTGVGVPSLVYAKV